MTTQQRAHAEKVVNRFRTMIGDASSQRVGDEHWDELTLLLESAIDAAVLEAGEKISDQLDAVVKNIRSDTEHFDRS